MAQSKGRPKLPRDKSGIPMGKNYLKKVKKMSQNNSNHAVAPTGSDFLATAERIEKETAQISAEQAPQIEIKKEQVQTPPQAPEADQAPSLASNQGASIPSPDWSDLIAPVVTGAGALLAVKTKCPGVAFNEVETKTLSKAYSDLINVMFPDISALSPKEKAILAALMATGAIAQVKYAVYQDHLAEQAKNKAQETKAAA